MVGLFRSSILLAGMLSVAACGKAPLSLSASDPSSPLRLERKIILAEVRGRIDHLAIDEGGGRLFVAEVENGSVDEIDLRAGKVIGRISGLREPQGVAYLPAQKELVVACGDGSVRFFSTDRRLIARIDLGDDADDVRIDPRNGHILVGYGKGAIATIDPAHHRLIGRLPLGGHPEGFQQVGTRLFANVPDRGAIIAADLDRGVVQATWRTGLHRLNFPMAVAPDGKHILLAYRLPAALASIKIADGTSDFVVPSCGDSDDLYVDGQRIFVICGAGHVNVQRWASGDTEVSVETAPGARTGLISIRRHELYVAAPARGDPAAIWVLAIAP